MKRFVFQLEPLLRKRKALEWRVQRDVARLERQRASIENQLRQHQMNLDSGKDAVRAAIVGSVDLHTLRFQAKATMDVTRKANELVLHLASVHKRLDRARERLRECARQRRAVELLRERRYEAWRQSCRKEEQNVLDDLASTSPLRNMPRC